MIPVSQPTQISVREPQGAEVQRTFTMTQQSTHRGSSRVYGGMFMEEEAAFKVRLLDGKGAESLAAYLKAEEQRMIYLRDLHKGQGDVEDIRERGFLPLRYAYTNPERPATLITGEGSDRTERPCVFIVTPLQKLGKDPDKDEYIDISDALRLHNLRKISEKYSGPLSAADLAAIRSHMARGVRALCLFLQAHITISQALLYAVDNLGNDVLLKWRALTDEDFFRSVCFLPSTPSPAQLPALGRCPGALIIDLANALKAEETPEECRESIGPYAARVPTDARDQEEQLQVLALTPFAAPPETSVGRWRAVCNHTRAAQPDQEAAEMVRINDLMDFMTAAMQIRGTMTWDRTAIYIGPTAASWGAGHGIRYYVSGDNYKMVTLQKNLKWDIKIREAKEGGRPDEVQAAEQEEERLADRMDLTNCLTWQDFVPTLFEPDGMAKTFRRKVKPLHKREEAELQWTKEVAAKLSKVAQAALNEDPSQRPHLQDILTALLAVHDSIMSAPVGLSGHSEEPSAPYVSSVEPVMGMEESQATSEVAAVRVAGNDAEQNDVQVSQSRWRRFFSSFFRRKGSKADELNAEEAAREEEEWTEVEMKETEGWQQHETRQRALWDHEVFEAAMEGAV
ncbi:unnamed protein product [Vitrella brassicaformis CCMP3155]|uniref:Protein kinase domain-containing protein n=1 Tax=Vitrella brassicaformis (strain CCMP3155) TaxID=1169540 RepID=A0A0G4FIZ7_VITBC|nr:unnamed protein product [Vitrella brassicaformis CCMP3155]|eukprot:CEM13738.1 unnamed protein product [Vitrella brassicaformis CCMP3155]